MAKTAKPKTEKTPKPEKNKYDKQMFLVKCHVTGDEKRVRKSVFMARVNRLQDYVKQITEGEQITVQEAIDALAEHYVSIAGRKQANCDFMGQPMDFAMALKEKPAKAKTPKAPKAAKVTKPKAAKVSKPAAKKAAPKKAVKTTPEVKAETATPEVPATTETEAEKPETKTTK